MCVGVPTKLVTVHGLLATGENYLGVEPVDLALVGSQPVGTWVLCFLGSAREVISKDDARKINAALEALRSIQIGGGVGSAFEDIEQAGPQLPPHLQAEFERQQRVKGN